LNTKLYFLYKFVQHLVPVYPVYLLLFEAKGLSVQQISLLLAIWSVPIVLLEVPTGVLADIWNRRNMLVIGSLCKTAAYLLWFFSEGFFLFAAGFILWGICESFVSGSEEALLYDSLKLEGEEGTFDRIYGKGNYYERIAVALSCLSGGFLAMGLGMKLVLAVSVFFMAVSTLIVLRFHEVNFYAGKSRRKYIEPLRQGITTLKDAIKLCTGNKLLFTVIAMFVTVIGVAGILDEYDSLIADRFGLNLGLVGIWTSVRYLLEAFGNRIAYRIKHKLVRFGIKDSFYGIGLVCIIAGVLLGLSGWFGSIALMPLYGLFYLLMSVAYVMQENYVQQKIEEQGRSTVHSVISLVHNLYAIGFFGLFSFILAGISILDVLVIAAGYITALCLLISLLYHRIKTRAAA